MTQKEDRRQAVEREVQKTLHALEKRPAIKASAFFSMRLRNRLDALNVVEPESVPRASKLRPVLLAVMFAMSVFIGIQIGKPSESMQTTDSLDHLIESYGLQAPEINQYQLTSTGN